MARGGGSCHGCTGRASARVSSAAFAVFLAALSAARVSATEESELILGISYGPFPAKQPVHPPGGKVIDDFMSEAAKPLWGSRGRGDLQLMKQMGANTVRLYGNNPKEQHGAFLDEALKQGLKTIPGISDYPYIQAANRCFDQGSGEFPKGDCYEAIKESYKQNLQNGFLKNGAYHPAIHSMIVINEPELKMHGTTPVDPSLFVKGILSAIDGMISAEEEMNVKGTKVKFTVTFSYAKCTLCTALPVPALGQMMALRQGFQNPSSFDYNPKNDLTTFYATRFWNSFNSANQASELQATFFIPYQTTFPTMQVAVLEFHRPDRPDWVLVNQYEDVKLMRQMALNSQQLVGFSFFEWQVRYDKANPNGQNDEQWFGMFELGNYRITTLEYYGWTYNVWCLESKRDMVTDRRLSEEITEVFGGEGLNYFALCRPDASKVLLDTEGFNQIRDNAADKATFITRLVQHLGGKVVDQAGMQSFAAGASDFNAIKVTLESRQGTTWASWEKNAACVADRSQGSAAIGTAVDKACKLGFDCTTIPAECAGRFWEKADYVLSASYHFRQDVHYSDGTLRAVFDDCYSGGSAIFAAPSYYRPKDTQCVVTTDPATTTLSDPGYQAILKLNNADLLATFFQRVVKEKLQGRVEDKKALQQFSASILKNENDGIGYNMKQLTETQLLGKLWVCGGNTPRTCSYSSGAQMWWIRYAFAALGALILIGVFCTVFYVRLGKQYKGMERQFCPCLPRSCREDSDSESD